MKNVNSKVSSKFISKYCSLFFQYKPIELFPETIILGQGNFFLFMISKNIFVVFKIPRDGLTPHKHPNLALIYDIQVIHRKPHQMSLEPPSR